MRAILMLMPLLLLATGPVSAAPVRVDHLRSGLACTKATPADGSNGWICQPTELVLLTDQGDCVFDNQDEHCTWVGFEFDYVADEAGEKLQCTSSHSHPVTEGNFAGVRSKDTDTESFELTLPAKSGHFYNPQFYVYGLAPEGDNELLEQTSCSSQGKTVFSFQFRLRFPAAAK